jgi:trans-aconitate methyltransferase
LDLFAIAEQVAETLDIGPGTRVFEVDCGRGELLFPFYSNGYIVGGTDGDSAAIEQALKEMPEGLFNVAMASSLDPAMPWDVVICRSLAGAPDTGYIRGLVARMLAKATHAIALLNVPEKHHQLLLHALAEAGGTAIQIDGADVFARI